MMVPRNFGLHYWRSCRDAPGRGPAGKGIG